MKCEKCGKEITSLNIGVFNRDGSDSDVKYDFCEVNNAVAVDLNPNWTGYELDADEAIDTIHCPHCGNFPFKNKELETSEYVSVVMYKDPENTSNLSFEQLKQRVGKPVFEADSKMWGIVDFDNQYPKTLYFCTSQNGVQITWDVKGRELKLYDMEVSE